MKLFNEIPSVLPFYTDIRNQNRFKENVKNKIPIPIFSPHNALLPFFIKLPKESPKPTSFKIIDMNNDEVDLSNNIDELKAVDFEDFAYCYYNGQPLIFKYDTYEKELDLKGNFYIELIIDEIKYFSEVFLMVCDITSESFDDKYMKIEFWDTSDIEPFRYRKDFKQVIYLDTFIHTSEPEIENENERDGNKNNIPKFSKLTIKQKVEVLVPDFLKIGLMSLEMHDNIFVYEQNKREGKIDRVKVTPTTEQDGAFSTLEIVIETDVLIKKICEENKMATNDNLWL